MDVIPTIRALREDAQTPSASRKLYREMPYDEYLRTDHWRKTRNAALSRAGWACMRCPAQRTLEVHHKTYERLGEELSGDLEVLCATCHQGHHIDEARRVHGVYVKLVSEVLAREKFRLLADLIEAVKTACVEQKIPYDGDLVWKAVKLVDASRQGVIDAPKVRAYVPPVDDYAERPISREEAKKILGARNLNTWILTHSMPRVELVKQRDLDRQKAMDIVCEAMLESYKKCEALEAELEQQKVGEK